MPPAGCNDRNAYRLPPGAQALPTDDDSPRRVRAAVAVSRATFGRPGESPCQGRQALFHVLDGGVQLLAVQRKVVV